MDVRVYRMDVGVYVGGVKTGYFSSHNISSQIVVLSRGRRSQSSSLALAHCLSVQCARLGDSGQGPEGRALLLHAPAGKESFNSRLGILL
jgi:hypothetical protein